MKIEDDIQAQLDKIKHKLNDATDKLNTEIERFEDGLKQISMGVRVIITLGDSKVKLCYDKWSPNTWRVIIIYSNRAGEEVANPLVDSPRNLRLFGYKHRMELIPAMMKAAEALTRRIEKALAGEIEEDGDKDNSYPQI